MQTVTPATNSITAAMVGNDLISGKDALTSSPADTDELLISDAGVLKRIDVSLVGGKNTPAFMAKMSASQDISNVTWTKIAFNTDVYDTDSTFDTSNYRFTPAVAGKYVFTLQVTLDDVPDQKEIYLKIYKNGSAESTSTTRLRVSGLEKTSSFCHWSDTSDADDYYEAYIYHNIGSTQDVRHDYGTIFMGHKLIGA